jgi:hypothetical protein
MKKLSTSLLSIFILIFAISCDIIDNPLKNAPVTPPDTTTVLRKVVIEDFTGHRCKNCPDAAKTIKTLEGVYGDQIIGVAIHAGPSTFTGTSPSYPTDYRTPEGNEIGIFFYGSIQGISLPSGMVSREGYTSSSSGHIKSFGAWGSAAATLVATEATFKLEQTASYNAADSTVNISIEVTALADMLDDLMFSVMVLESGIVSPQLMPDDTRNETYVHNHVLRTMYTPALGSLLQPSPIQAGQKITKTLQGTFKPSKWDVTKSDIVIYLFNAETYEILQAEVTRLSL